MRLLIVDLMTSVFKQASTGVCEERCKPQNGMLVTGCIVSNSHCSSASIPRLFCGQDPLLFLSIECAKVLPKVFALYYV